MRILYLNPIGGLGGGERSLLDVLAAVRKSEPTWELHLIAGADGALIGEAATLGVQTEVLAMPDELLTAGDSAGKGGRVLNTLALIQRALSAGWGARRYAKQLRERIAAIGPNLIHSNGIKFHVLTRMIGKQRAPIVWHIRDFIGSRRLMRTALRWASTVVKMAVANSEATAADARGVLRRVPVRTILNCIDLDRFTPRARSGEMLDDFAGMSRAESGVLRVGLLASFARWKGQDLLLRAAVIAKSSAPDLRVRYFIVGGPIYKTKGSQFSVDELRAIAEENGIADQVGLIPFQNDPAEIYRALDIVVHASTQPEPFGRTIAEGMACGRAVIVANAGGAAELFADGVDALGVQPGDATALAAAIVRLARDPELRAALGRNARTTAELKFSPERMSGELMALYKEVLA